MKPDKIIVQRFSDLAHKATEIENTYRQDRDGFDVIDSEKFHGWATSVLSLLHTIFGMDSPQFQNFSEHYKKYLGYSYNFEICRGIFSSAKEDYESGYLFTIRGLIKAEDSIDILEQATELLKSGYKDPACILIGVSLEIALKELCVRNEISIGKLDSMNSELCKKGIYNTGMQKQITAWAHLRNKAAHGEWNEYNDADIEDMAKGVTRFIADFL
jgi:hypothetical protein